MVEVRAHYPQAYLRSPVPEDHVQMTENLRVPMRDGVTLCVDVYAPKSGGPFPVLLSLSPYSKDIQQNPPQWSHAIESGATGFYVSHGYIHVIAQVRGCGLSQGQWQWFDEKERTDGYDLVEWIAAQSWCDGNVGMIGDSYWSWSQYFVAAAQPPHLRCICQCDATTDLYRDACYPGGIFNAAFMNDWVAYQTAMSAWPGAVDGKLPPMNTHFEIAQHPVDGPWWRERSAITYLDKIEVPVMSIAPQGGQMHFRGQLAGYPQIKSPKKLLVVPPTGFWSHVRYLTHPALNAQMLRWFDHWLKGKDTGILQEPEVAIFDSGTRSWSHEEAYPSPRINWTKFFLNEHALSIEAPQVHQAADAYRLPESYALHVKGQPSLSYESGALSMPLRLAGPVSLTLHASSSQIDTLWFVNLFDIDPQGKATALSRGMLRASLRAVDERASKPGQPWHPFDVMEPLQPSKVYDFEIEMRPVFHTLKVGHRLQLTISSEDIQFNNPLRNIDVQLLPWPVENTIFRDVAHPSHLTLPICTADESVPVRAPISEIEWPLVPGQWMADTKGHPLKA